MRRAYSILTISAVAWITVSHGFGTVGAQSLRLERGNVPAEFIIIDAAERPTEN
jgi:hypothetical protein